MFVLQGRREDFKAYSLEVHHKVKASLSLRIMTIFTLNVFAFAKVDYTPRFISKISIKVRIMPDTLNYQDDAIAENRTSS